MITKSDVPVARCWLIPSTSVMPGTRMAAPPMPSRPLSRPVSAPITTTTFHLAVTSISGAAVAAATGLPPGRDGLVAQRPVHQAARPLTAQHPHHLVERLGPVQLDRLLRV